MRKVSEAKSDARVRMDGSGWMESWIWTEGKPRAKHGLSSVPPAAEQHSTAQRRNPLKSPPFSLAFSWTFALWMDCGRALWPTGPTINFAPRVEELLGNTRRSHLSS